MSEFLWVVFPYLALTLFAVGSLARYAYRPMAWGSRSSEILEKRWLHWGSLLFHWGILFVFFGHVFGLLVPIEVYQALGVSSQMYHLGADTMGGLAGLATWVGLDILILRRLVHLRVRLNTSLGDWVSLGLLWIVVTLGDAETIVRNNLVGPYEYRLTVGPWVRELFTLHPNAALMTHVPLLLQVHIVAAFVLFAVWPFTRLVHVFSLPLAYLRRAPIQYRSRSHPGTKDARAWVAPYGQEGR